MRLYLIFALAVILAIGLVSCSDDSKTTTAEGPFRGGTEGIIASFEQFSVKEDNIYTLFNTEDFPIEVLLKNKGEEDIEPGQVHLRLLGPAPGDFENIPEWQITNRQRIEKISEFNTQGGEETLSFTPQSYARYTGAVTGFFDINWNVEYWYDYKTYAIINDVCFKGDPADEKICIIKESKAFAVSGAPIVVTGVSEDAAGKGIIVLKIDIQNKGKGEATLPGAEFDARFSQVSYTIDEPGKWECKSAGRENEARFIDGKAQVLCRLKTPLAEGDLYTKSVQMTFEYQYKELVQERLRIKESVS